MRIGALRLGGGSLFNLPSVLAEYLEAEVVNIPDLREAVEFIRQMEPEDVYFVLLAEMEGGRLISSERGTAEAVERFCTFLPDDRIAVLMGTLLVHRLASPEEIAAKYGKKIIFTEEVSMELAQRIREFLPSVPAV